MIEHAGRYVRASLSPPYTYIHYSALSAVLNAVIAGSFVVVSGGQWTIGALTFLMVMGVWLGGIACGERHATDRVIAEFRAHLSTNPNRPLVTPQPASAQTSSPSIVEEVERIAQDAFDHDQPA